LVFLVYLVYLVCLVSFDKTNKINPQTRITDSTLFRTGAFTPQLAYSSALKVASNPGLFADISDRTLSDTYDLWMNT